MEKTFRRSARAASATKRFAFDERARASLVHKRKAATLTSKVKNGEDEELGVKREMPAEKRQKVDDEGEKEADSKSDKEPLPTRNADGELEFRTHPAFRPNLTPEEIMKRGSFGGGYFRPIYSSVLGQNLKDQWKEFPRSWFPDNTDRYVASPTYRPEVNYYKVKCGASLEEWESSGWIVKQDPYGWFQWYCRYYLGRRTSDDARQIDRWLKCCGPTGRWKRNLVTKCIRAGKKHDNHSVSPVVRQTLQHWGYELQAKDLP